MWAWLTFDLCHLYVGRFVKSEHGKSLAALALLLTCMYTGENADRISGLPSHQDSMGELSESVYQSREHILNILERWVCVNGSEGGRPRLIQNIQSCFVVGNLSIALLTTLIGS